jgi:hypothetical protein
VSHRCCLVTCKCEFWQCPVGPLSGPLPSRPVTESMTRTTRRTTRNSASQLPGSDAIGSDSPAAETDPTYTQEDLCPSCSVSLTRNQVKDDDNESWVRCDFCKTWYHWRCVGENGQLETIDKWFVPPLSVCYALHSLHVPGSAVPVEPPIVDELSP